MYIVYMKYLRPSFKYSVNLVNGYKKLWIFDKYALKEISTALLECINV